MIIMALASEYGVMHQDFLDAQVGSTDNRKGWQVAAVSQPTGSSFDEARMTLQQVKSAMEVSLVIIVYCSVIMRLSSKMIFDLLLFLLTVYSLAPSSLTISEHTFPDLRVPLWQARMHYLSRGHSTCT